MFITNITVLAKINKLLGIQVTMNNSESTADSSRMADTIEEGEFRGAVGRRASKFRRSGSNVQAVQETMKEKQVTTV